MRQRRSLRVEPLENRVMLAVDSMGINGIDARGLGLDGSGVDIGQVEIDRPGVPGFDRAIHTHPDVAPTAVFEQDLPAVADRNTGYETGHATQVAGVMIANDPNSNSSQNNSGVAPGANLYASAKINTGDTLEEVHDDFVRSIQQVAVQNAGGVRATNLSFYTEGNLDSNSLLTSGLDWSAQAHDVLYVVARGNAGSEGSVPTDNYNGINVGSTEAVEIDGEKVFSRVSQNNNSDVGTTHLVAPGENIDVAWAGVGGYVPRSGTSLAAPHATGTVALLQQQVNRWGDDAGNAQRHEVMKAVLINSADKLKDEGDGKLLGMTKEIVLPNGTDTWLTSDARDDHSNPGGQFIPLDPAMGAGQLNARRALAQLLPGEQNVPASDETVPVIGWDYHAMANAGDVVKYALDGFLLGGSYISMTLTWDRLVSLIDSDSDGIYDTGESFSSGELADLDLFLMPQGATQLAENLWSSRSAFNENVEHIFFELPQASAEYEIWVRQNGNIGANYALAWWAVEGSAPPSQPGRIGDLVWDDTNQDGIQDEGEPGLAYVTVDLIDANLGTWIATTTTDSNGKYEFTDVAAGDYYVEFTNPAGYIFTLKDVGDDELDSDVDANGRTDAFTVSSETSIRIDAGDAGLISVPYGWVGDYVWNDTNADGIQDMDESGIQDVVVYLYRSDDSFVDVTATDENGFYQFTSVQPGEYYVWFGAMVGYDFTDQDYGTDDSLDSDADASGRTALFSVPSGNMMGIDAGLVQYTSIGDFVWHDTNANGIQDDDETGAANVGVELFDTQSDALIASTTTDTDGYFGFTDVWPGTYYVKFTIPDGYGFTLENVGDNQSDSDANENGRTGALIVSAGDTMDVDAGLIPYASIGDYVWSDANADGIQDESESGVQDVVVQLYDATNGDFVDSTTTDASGFYQFYSIRPGNYWLRFEFDLVDDWFTVQNKNDDDAVDSDVDALGHTDVFTILPGDVVDTIDAGIVPNLDAYELDQLHDLRFTGTFYENLINLGEKWLRGGNEWYFIQPDGSINRWKGTLARSELVGTLDLSYYADPSALYDAVERGTGSGETGSGETGSGETGSGETGSVETSSGETGSGGIDAGDVSVEQRAYDVDQNHKLRFTGTYYENLVNAGEKWLKGEDGWYFIKPDGGVYRWTGSLATSELVDTLDETYHADPSKLHDAQEPVASDNETGAVDPLVEQARDLDRQYELRSTGNYYENLINLGEKWLRGSDGWVFIKPDGSVYLWSGSAATSQLVGSLDATYHADPSKLHNANDVNANAVASSNDNADVAQAAHELTQNKNFKYTGNYHEDLINLGEKWLRGSDGWYFIKADGSVYRWTGNVATSQLVATLDASYHVDPSKFFSATQA